VIIQPIVFPKKEIISNDLLYFDIKGDVTVDTGIQKLTFKMNSEISFNSYFNSFSLNKWKKYTVLENLSINITYKGHFELTIVSRDLKNKLVFEQVQKKITLSANEKKTIDVDVQDMNHDMIFFKMKAKDDHSIFYSGSYCSEVPKEKVNPTDICVVICTYKREEYIKKNLSILKKYIIENLASPLRNHLSIFVVDNGKTIEKNKYESDQIRIIYNKNAGGSGGFTRGLIEAMEDQRTFSHVLFLDDDTVIEPISLTRTYHFLQLRQKQYEDLFLGGSMLNLLHPSIQEEAGASWNGGIIKPNKKDLDLTSSYNLLLNEMEEEVEYNGWWFCCIPLSIVSEKNLPIPVFLHNDDIEYGLRNIKNITTLNGICIWHLPFKNKYDSYLIYYFFRNLLICNAMHYTDKGIWFFLKLFYKHIIKYILFYRYKEANLLLDGVEDYYKGIDWLKKQEPERLHLKISEKGEKIRNLEQVDLPYLNFLPLEYHTQKEGIISKIFRTITLNGYFFKAKYNLIINLTEYNLSIAETRDFYRANNLIFYDRRNLKVFTTKKSYRSLFKIIKRTIKVSLMTFMKYRKTNLEYKKRQDEITNMEFWKDYLGLK